MKINIFTATGLKTRTALSTKTQQHAHYEPESRVYSDSVSENERERTTIQGALNILLPGDTIVIQSKTTNIIVEMKF